MRSNKSKPDQKPEQSAAASQAPANSAPATNGTANQSRPTYRTAERVEARLNPYIEAHSKDLEYYKRLIAENPERAARTLMLKDLEMHEEVMKRINRQLPKAKEFYDQQTPEVRKRIDDAVARVNPYHHDQAFVGEVLSEYNRQNFGKLFGNKQAPAQNAPAPAMGAAAG